MNILIPDSWLREHLDTKATWQEIQKLLSLSGPSVERVYETDQDPIYDIEVTTNRVDSYSVRGIAREAAVILDQAGISSVLKPLSGLPAQTTLPAPAQELPSPKVVSNPALSKRITFVILDTVAHTPTPDWMAARLTQIGQNVHDSIIDISNYITHELGHPCHAFDYDKIMKLGGEIRVVEAQPGQPFTLLDGVEYITKGGEIVFVNPAGEIIDLPAIKGTANSSIGDDTTRVMLWIESLDARKVRTTSMSHAIRTVAAQLNEKNVDPELALPTLLRGVELYQELCGAVVASKIYDEFPGKSTPQSVALTSRELSRYLGLELPQTQVVTILEALGCHVVVDSDTRLTVTPPTFRPDITIPADLVEEVARIVGYHTLPSTLMATPIPLTKPTDTNFAAETKAKRFLANVGWTEGYTYSLVSAEIAASSDYALGDHLKLSNPLTEDRVYLRRSLVPSLQEIVENHPTRSSISIFELANTYDKTKGDRHSDALTLALVTTQNYRVLRGVIEALAKYFFVTEVHVVEDATPATGYLQSGTLMVGEVRVGTIGKRNEKLVAAQLTWSKWLSVIHSHPSYRSPVTTALIVEDLTFSLPPAAKVGELMSDIAHLSPLVVGVALADVYEKSQERRVTLRLSYQDPAEHITSEVVAPLRKEIATRAKSTYGAELVGEV
jgi:phenylalanyl-tRNA synthetase beta chain